MIAVLSRKQELNDALGALERGEWLAELDQPSTRSSAEISRRAVRSRLVAVLRKLEREYPHSSAEIASGACVKTIYRKLVAIHAQASEWADDLDACVSQESAEKQLLTCARLESLDRAQELVYARLYQTKHAQEETVAPVTLWAKAAAWLALAVMLFALVYFTLAYLLSVRQTPGAGASTTRKWYQMSLFAQILAIVVFEPL